MMNLNCRKMKECKKHENLNIKLNKYDAQWIYFAALVFLLYSYCKHCSFQISLEKISNKSI